MKKQMTEKLKTNRGITLIALVITIIVMLILVAVTISMAVNGGLFGYAGRATAETNNVIKAEQELGSGKITIDNKVYNSIDEYLNGGEEDSTLKPMVLKFNIMEEDYSISMCIHQEKHYDYDKTGNVTVTELPNNTDVTIDWGDGDVEHYTSNNLNEEDGGYVNHEYSEPDEDVTVTITGVCNTIEVYDYSLKEIEAWGNTETYCYKFASEGLVSIATPEKNTFKNVINFDNTFENCYNLTSIPEGLFANCSSVKSFDDTFAYCENLTNIPKNLFNGCSSAESFNYTFKYCQNLTSIPEGLFANCSSVKNFLETFAYCGITSIAENIFENCNSVKFFNRTFYYCDGLLSIPEHLFDDCQQVVDFKACFIGCSSLTGRAIPLWERVQESEGFEGTWVGIPDGWGCYSHCEGLENYDSIPSYWRDPHVDE